MRLLQTNKTSGRLASSALSNSAQAGLRLLLSRALSSRLAAFSMPPRRGGHKSPTNHRKDLIAHDTV